jgi:phosphatidylserine decarboxylase
MIHREGYVTIAIVFIAVALLALLGYKFIPRPINYIIYTLGLVLAVVVLQFFRNPTRTIPDLPNTVLSPADGKVVVIEKVMEKRFFNREMMQVSIFMSPFNVHVNRVPFTGRVVHSKYHEGKYLVAFHPKSSDLNESTTVVYEHGSGQQVMVRQIAGAVARRIVCYMKEGQFVKAGEEMGFIKFGSRADIFLPLGAKINVGLGDVCRGGLTEIADLQ